MVEALLCDFEARSHHDAGEVNDRKGRSGHRIGGPLSDSYLRERSPSCICWCGSRASPSCIEDASIGSTTGYVYVTDHRSVYLVDALNLAPSPRHIGIGVKRLHEIVLRALYTNNRDINFREDRPRVNVSERPLAQLYSPFDRDGIVHSGVDIERQRCRHLGI